MLFSNTYLYRVKQKNRALFYFSIVFIVLTLVANVTRNELTPFFTWSMYSAKTPYADTFAVYILEYNDGKIYNEPRTWKDHQRMIFFYTIDYYTGIMDNGGREADALKMQGVFKRLHMSDMPLSHLYNTAPDLKDYPSWLKRYMQANMGVRMDSIKVFRQWVRYNDKGEVYPIKNELIFKV